jgi:hypothetical protein
MMKATLSFIHHSHCRIHHFVKYFSATTHRCLEGGGRDNSRSRFKRREVRAVFKLGARRCRKKSLILRGGRIYCAGQEVRAGVLN